LGMWPEERKVQGNLRKTGLAVWKRTVHGQTYPTVHGQKRRKIEPLGRNQSRPSRGNRTFIILLLLLKLEDSRKLANFDMQYLTDRGCNLPAVGVIFLNKIIIFIAVMP
jgi:hypothetical protein